MKKETNFTDWTNELVGVLRERGMQNAIYPNDYQKYFEEGKSVKEVADLIYPEPKKKEEDEQ